MVVRDSLSAPSGPSGRATQRLPVLLEAPGGQGVPEVLMGQWDPEGNCPPVFDAEKELKRRCIESGGDGGKEEKVCKSL